MDGRRARARDGRVAIVGCRRHCEGEGPVFYGVLVHCALVNSWPSSHCDPFQPTLSEYTPAVSAPVGTSDVKKNSGRTCSVRARPRCPWSARAKLRTPQLCDERMWLTEHAQVQCTRGDRCFCALDYLFEYADRTRLLADGKSRSTQDPCNGSASGSDVQALGDGGEGRRVRTNLHCALTCVLGFCSVAQYGPTYGETLGCRSMR